MLHMIANWLERRGNSQVDLKLSRTSWCDKARRRITSGKEWCKENVGILVRIKNKRELMRIYTLNKESICPFLNSFCGWANLHVHVISRKLRQQIPLGPRRFFRSHIPSSKGSRNGNSNIGAGDAIDAFSRAHESGLSE
jgi:hypothetical protein